MTMTTRFLTVEKGVTEMEREKAQESPVELDQN